MISKSQIVATIGPASSSSDTLCKMIENGLDVARLNFSWGSFEERKEQITLIRELARKCKRQVLILVDLPGPRIQKTSGHTYDTSSTEMITEKDKEYIKFAIDQGVDYLGLSYIGNKNDVIKYKEIIRSMGGNQKVIAKIERSDAVSNLEEIISESDAVMVARGDLGSEVPLEQIPFVQQTIIEKSNLAGKPVIVATQMMLTMTENDTPTRAEVTDVSIAIMEGADAVMLSEETAQGKHPIETVAMMEKIISESEIHLNKQDNFNHLKPLGQ